MNRKIVQHGASTLTISLPYRWAEQYNLKKGDEITLEPLGRNILIRIDRELKKASKTLTFKKGQPFLKRVLLNLYRTGYDEVVLEFQDPLPIADILEKMDELLGFEIVEQTERSCTIRNVASVMPEEFDAILRRLFMVTHSAMAAVTESMGKKDYRKLVSAASIEKENNKLVNYCQRVLNKGIEADISVITARFSATERLERIGDALGDLSAYLYTRDPRFSDRTPGFFSALQGFFQSIYIHYFRQSPNPAELKAQRDTLYQWYADLCAQKNPDPVILAHAKQILEELHHLEISL